MKRMMKTIFFAAATAALLTITAAAASAGAGIVNVSSLNLRAAADLSAEIREVIPGGSCVVISEKTGDWYKVVYKGTVGWAAAEFIDFYENIDADLGYGVVCGDSVRMRDAPGFVSFVTEHFNNGTTLSVSGVYGEWYKVNLIGGNEGYIHSDYFGLRGEPLPRNEAEGRRITDTAMKYLGLPYLWGGTGPGGFDCSGFVYSVYKECGYKINRTADTIFKNGKFVEKWDLQTGDAICFTNSGGSEIGHVGIYLGNGLFIHSSSVHDGVIITELDSEYYTDNYVGARRIV
ncbi:MAG: NlpC/P60 family protein [Oscillospiraceae bacterium]|nr:NlpC/P60 family protein [Oscillospiraceae bacterium]